MAAWSDSTDTVELDLHAGKNAAVTHHDFSVGKPPNESFHSLSNSKLFRTHIAAPHKTSAR
jgi:hypothetical protein